MIVSLLRRQLSSNTQSQAEEFPLLRHSLACEVGRPRLLLPLQSRAHHRLQCMIGFHSYQADLHCHFFHSMGSLPHDVFVRAMPALWQAKPDPILLVNKLEIFVVRLPSEKRTLQGLHALRTMLQNAQPLRNTPLCDVLYSATVLVVVRKTLQRRYDE